MKSLLKKKKKGLLKFPMPSEKLRRSFKRTLQVLFFSFLVRFCSLENKEKGLGGPWPVYFHCFGACH